MPRDIAERMRRRQDFIKRMEEKAPRRKPARTRAKLTGSLFAIRNKRIAIREGALRVRQIVITYVKTTTGERKKYIVAPYSYRYRRLRVGWRKMLYAWDMADKRTKSFAIRNIRNVALTERKFRPKWTVEIK
jgi:hypothetical protein